MNHLKKLYAKVYPNCDIAFEQLMDMVNDYAHKRPNALKKLDLEGTEWIESGNTVGMMLYVDLFSESIENLIKKSQYFEKLGITLIHLMPILEPRAGENDGGYAVKSYREIDPRVGDMAIFEKLITHYHKKGIRVCIDYVINHTSNDHEWAQKALDGDKIYQEYYYFFDDNSIPNQYEETLNEVFPGVAPGNFTYLNAIDKWVMTTFYPFQWDLNYKNPVVFKEMAENLLFLANKGVDMIRLDAIPYIWKVLGTSCRNLPEVYDILALFRKIIEIAAPSTALLGEAIVQPELIVKYFGEENNLQCHTLYNASYMVEIWNAIATRDARYIVNMPNYKIPSKATWINYARCHDDIGWGLDTQKIQNLGFDPHAHKMFLIDFYHGVLKGSFSKGELYEFNPLTLDARNSGTLASLAGLEMAIELKDRYQKSIALRRIELIHGLFMFKSGIPMLYSGDEIATLNDYSYKEDSHKCHDSRWVHRSKFNWSDVDASRLLNCENHVTIVYSKIKELIETRKSIYSDYKVIDEQIIAFDNRHVLGYKQLLKPSSKQSTKPSTQSSSKETSKKVLKSHGLIQLFNVSEDRQWIYTSELKRHGLQGVWCDQISGKTVNFDEEVLLLGPYEIILLRK